MRSLAAVLSIVVSLICGSAASAQPQRLYLPVQSVTVTKSGTLVCRCADGSRRPAPKSDEVYTGLHGEIFVSRKRPGERASDAVPMTAAIEKGWVRVHGNNGRDTSVVVANLDESYTLTVEVRKNSLLLPTPTDLSEAERSQFDANAKYAPEVMRSAADAHPELKEHVGEFSPLVALSPIQGSIPFLLDPEKKVETPPGPVVNSSVAKVFGTIYDQTQSWAAEDRYTFLWLMLGKEPTQTAMNVLAKVQVVSDKTLPVAKLDDQSRAHVHAIVELNRQLVRTSAAEQENTPKDILLPMQALYAFVGGKRIAADARPPMMLKIRSVLSRVMHKRDVKSCEGVARPNDVVISFDGPDLLVSVEKDGRRISVPVPMTVFREVAAEQYNSDLNGRRFQGLLLEKPDQLGERLINNRYPSGLKQGSPLDNAAAGYGYLPLLHAIVTSVKGVERPVVFMRGSSASVIDFAYMYAMAQAAGVAGYDRDVTFVTVADYGQRADPVRQAVENYNRQEGFSNIRRVLTLALPDPNNSELATNLVWQWMTGLTLRNKDGVELPNQGQGPPIRVTLPLLKQLIGPYVELANSLGLGAAFIHDPATAGEYWKRVGQAFEGHTGDGAIVNVFTGHSSAKGGDYLYFRDERVAWQDFLQGRPMRVLPRDYIQADFRCYAGSARLVEDVLAGPGAATMAISPVGQIDIVESRYLIDAFLNALKDVPPAKAYSRAMKEYHERLRREKRAETFQFRFQRELPRLHSQRPIGPRPIYS